MQRVEGEWRQLTEMQMMNSKQKPTAEVKLGACRATVWANETANGTRYNVTLSRLYKDESGSWKDSTSFGRDDLPQIAEAARQAWFWIFENVSSNSSVKNENQG
jgi:hypothetical protein